MENQKAWKVGKMLLGPKHKPIERTAIYEPTTQDFLKDPKDILAKTMKYKVGVPIAKWLNGCKITI